MLAWLVVKRARVDARDLNRGCLGRAKDKPAVRAVPAAMAERRDNVDLITPDRPRRRDNGMKSARQVARSQRDDRLDLSLHVGAKASLDTPVRQRSNEWSG